ncbi:MAG TPA: nicotinate-nucleotide adenylyltransferase [Gaiellaceae bacterium]|nr:nicotinate-nucleotide adenylyltransferase [Gaiellaceae bacterium]
MTVGLLGGAFDPPHLGHVALAREALERFALDRLLVVVTGEPPHKEVATDAETRFALAEAAFGALPGVQLSRRELDRPGPSYTVDTVRWAEERWGDVVFLIGADELADFLAWKAPDEILEHARLGVATRPGFHRERLDPVLTRLRRPERIELFEIPAIRVSSSDVRERVRRGEPIDGLVPDEVARLVVERGLYHEGC